MWDTEAGSISLSYIPAQCAVAFPIAAVLTGTFFCEITTAQSLPRTPNEVMFAAVIALKAYSAR